MPVPHYHESWGEMVHGLAGTSTWRVDGKDAEVTPGAAIFIKRGIVHGFDNRSGALAKCLCVLTPGVLGPAYFREVSALVAVGTPDLARIKETVLHYGLVPAPQPKPFAGRIGSALDQPRIARRRSRPPRAM